jgi:hypothetical protein
VLLQFAAPEVFVVLTHCVEYPAEFTNLNQIEPWYEFVPAAWQTTETSV